ncbi:hypothetical protein [Plantibacter sp. RU18]|uniref:hypothetical protein n=1 Tax=Plantibacter sp. RU18 TaxID=3158143 RepID=UPI003D35D0C9
MNTQIVSPDWRMMTPARTPGGQHGFRRPWLAMAVSFGVVTASLTFGALPAQADDYPSWADVEAAKSSESAKAAEITNITSLIALVAGDLRRRVPYRADRRGGLSSGAGLGHRGDRS